MHSASSAMRASVGIVVITPRRNTVGALVQVEV